MAIMVRNFENRMKAVYAVGLYCKGLVLFQVGTRMSTFLNGGFLGPTFTRFTRFPPPPSSLFGPTTQQQKRSSSRFQPFKALLGSSNKSLIQVKLETQDYTRQWQTSLRFVWLYLIVRVRGGEITLFTPPSLLPCMHNERRQ